MQFTGSPEAFSPPTQIPFLNAAIAKKPDAILIAPTDKSALIAPIQRAVDAGIPVITVDTFITKPIAFTNISTDNLAGGRAAADALVKAIGGSGEVAGISVNPGISTTDQRQQGFEQELKKYPKVKYLGTQYCNDDQTKATNLTSALLAGHPNLKGVFAMNVVSGNGVTAAVKAAGQVRQGEARRVRRRPAAGAGAQGGHDRRAHRPVPVRDRAAGRLELAYKYVTGQGRDQEALRHRLGGHHARERQLARDQEVPLHALIGRHDRWAPPQRRPPLIQVPASAAEAIASSTSTKPGTSAAHPQLERAAHGHVGDGG